MKPEVLCWFSVMLGQNLYWAEIKMMSVFSLETGTFVWSITASWHDWGSHLDINISTASDKIALNINMNLNRPINRYWCPIDSSLNETFIKTQQSDAFRRLKPCDYPSPWMFYAVQYSCSCLSTVHSNHRCSNIDSVRPWTMNGATAYFVGVYLFMQPVVFMTLLRGRENNKYQAEMKYEERILTNRGFKVLLGSHPRHRSLLLALLVCARIQDLNNEEQQSFHCQTSSSSSSPQTSSPSSLSRSLPSRIRRREILT